MTSATEVVMLSGYCQRSFHWYQAATFLVHRLLSPALLWLSATGEQSSSEAQASWAWSTLARAWFTLRKQCQRSEHWQCARWHQFSIRDSSCQRWWTLRVCWKTWPFCHIWHKVLCHLALFIRMQLHKFQQDVILLLAKAAFLNTSNLIEHCSPCPAIWSGVWKCLLASANVIPIANVIGPMKLQDDLAVRTVT